MKYKRFTERVDSGFVSELDCRIAYNKLSAIEDKIEQGTLIEFPCKVGDTFWCINKTKYGLPFVMDMTVDYFEIHNGVFYMGHYNSFCVRAWQKDDLFLTREEAEAKLKEVQNG